MRFAQADWIPFHHRTGRQTRGLQADATIRGLADRAGGFVHQRKQVERFFLQFQRLVVELGDVAQLTDERAEPRARFLGLLDHLAVAIRERRFGVTLQHAQVAADDRDRGAEFVDSQREELRVTSRQPCGVVIHRTSIPGALGTGSWGLGLGTGGLGTEPGARSRNAPEPGARSLRARNPSCRPRPYPIMRPAGIFCRVSGIYMDESLC